MTVAVPASASACSPGATATVAASSAAPNAPTTRSPRPTGVGQRCGRGREDRQLEHEHVVAAELPHERARHGRRAVRARHAERERRRLAREGEAGPAEAGDERAVTTPAAASAARRSGLRTGASASGRRPRQPSTPSSGPTTNASPLRASRQKSASQAAASAAYKSASPSETFPSGRIGTASANASPARPRHGAARRPRARGRPGNPPGKKGSVEAVQPRGGPRTRPAPPGPRPAAGAGAPARRALAAATGPGLAQLVREAGGGQAARAGRAASARSTSTVSGFGRSGPLRSRAAGRRPR